MRLNLNADQNKSHDVVDPKTVGLPRGERSMVWGGTIIAASFTLHCLYSSKTLKTINTCMFFSDHSQFIQ